MGLPGPTLLTEVCLVASWGWEQVRRTLLLRSFFLSEPKQVGAAWNLSPHKGFIYLKFSVSLQNCHTVGMQHQHDYLEQSSIQGKIEWEAESPNTPCFRTCTASLTIHKPLVGRGTLFIYNQWRTMTHHNQSPDISLVWFLQLEYEIPRYVVPTCHSFWCVWCGLLGLVVWCLTLNGGSTLSLLSSFCFFLSHQFLGSTVGCWPTVLEQPALLAFIIFMFQFWKFLFTCPQAQRFFSHV